MHEKFLFRHITNNHYGNMGYNVFNTLQRREFTDTKNTFKFPIQNNLLSTQQQRILPDTRIFCRSARHPISKFRCVGQRSYSHKRPLYIVGGSSSENATDGSCIDDDAVVGETRQLPVPLVPVPRALYRLRTNWSVSDLNIAQYWIVIEEFRTNGLRIWLLIGFPYTFCERIAKFQEEEVYYLSRKKDGRFRSSKFGLG